MGNAQLSVAPKNCISPTTSGVKLCEGRAHLNRCESAGLNKELPHDTRIAPRNSGSVSFCYKLRAIGVFPTLPNTLRNIQTLYASATLATLQTARFCLGSEVPHSCVSASCECAIPIPPRRWGIYFTNAHLMYTQLSSKVVIFA